MGRLFQREEQIEDRLMCRHVRKEGEMLAVERKVAHLLTAGG